MNTDTLKMFITVTQKGSISAAAQELGYAQSNISTKVHQLEEDLRTQLFYRSNRGITLTDSGKELYQRAIKIVSLTDDTINKLQHPQEIQGQLHIGTLQTAASTYLPTILSQYHHHNPNVELSIETGTTLASVSAGLGISVLPRKVAEPFTVNKTIKTLDLPAEFSTLPVSFIYRKDYIISRSFEKFLDILR